MLPSLSRTSGPLPAAQAADGPADDATLIAAARANPQAFGLLYERYVDPIYRYCHIQLGNRTAAEDATSETFLKALAGLRGFRNGNVAAWLFQIARNVVIDVHRRRPTAPIGAAGEVADPARGPEATALARAEHGSLRKALAALPKDQHAAVVLQLAGWSGEQIAAALDKKSTAAVYMLRARALARLAKTLRRDGWGTRESGDDAS